jgi:hypothetical protein
MAARQGHKKMFTLLLAKSRQVMWSYGPITCARYPLTEIDTTSTVASRDADENYALRYAHPGWKGRRIGALEMLLIYRHRDMLLLPVISQILEDKWDRFRTASDDAHRPTITSPMRNARFDYHSTPLFPPHTHKDTPHTHAHTHARTHARTHALAHTYTHARTHARTLTHALTCPTAASSTRTLWCGWW